MKEYQHWSIVKMSEENINIPHSGCHIPDDAVFYKNCGCGGHHDHAPQKIAIFNIETNILSVNITGEV